MGRLCKKCDKWKSDEEFLPRGQICLKCKKENKKVYRKRYYEKHKERAKRAGKKWREENREKASKASRDYYKKNKEKVSERNRKWREGNLEKVGKQAKKWRKENREKINRQHREYYAKNKEKINRRRTELIKEKGGDYVRKSQRHWISTHYSKDENFRAAHDIRCYLGRAYRRFLKTGKLRTTENKYGLDYKKIFTHMGECPGEYGKGNGKYTIQHKVPLRCLRLDTETGLKIATHPLNHMWMLFEDNYFTGQEWDMDAYGMICEDLGIGNGR